jgi:hypothetical protein
VLLLLLPPQKVERQISNIQKKGASVTKRFDRNQDPLCCGGMLVYSLDFLNF